MKILHTSDWHVGKVLKGRDRHDEHVAALGSLVATAREEDVDLVLIAGDLFETSAPTARSQGLVMQTLLALREDGRQVVVIAGNHDNQSLIEAVYRPVLGQIGLHVFGVRDVAAVQRGCQRIGAPLHVHLIYALFQPPFHSIRHNVEKRQHTRTGAMPVRLGPAGIVDVMLPTLSAVEQVALDNALMM